MDIEKKQEISCVSAMDEDLVGIIEIFSATLHKGKLEEIETIVMREQREGHRYIVAKQGEKVIGFVSWRVWGEPRHRLCELYHIGVSPGAQGLGVGRKLVEALVAAGHGFYCSYNLQGIRKLFVLTHENNAMARQFYESLGFKLEVILPSFFHGGVDECFYAQHFF